MHDVRAIKFVVVNKRVALLAVEDLVFQFAFGPSSFDDHAERARWSARCMRDIGWNEECFAFTYYMVDDLTVFISLNNDVAHELQEELFRVGLVEIVTSIGARNDHHKEVGPTVEVLVAYGWLERLAVLLDPFHQMNGDADAAICFDSIGFHRSVRIRDQALGSIPAHMSTPLKISPLLHPTPTIESGTVLGCLLMKLLGIQWIALYAALVGCSAGVPEAVAPKEPGVPARLTVRVEGVVDPEGTINVGIYSNPDSWLTEEGVTFGKIEPVGKKGEIVSVVFDSIPAGIYAVSLYQDIDESKSFARGALGIPTEPWGMSNNASGGLSAPTFKDAAITVSAPATEIDIRLRNGLGWPTDPDS